MFDRIRADIHELTRQETSFVMKLGVLVLHPGLHSVLLYRTSRWFYLHRMRALSILMNYLNSFITGAQISHRAEIGKGLVIYHPHGIVIGATAVLGECCILVHGNVIGQFFGGGDRPVIGDRFFAATGAKMLGKIRIGSDVRVGPNAVVLDSLPDGVTVAGNPARIIPNREALHAGSAVSQKRTGKDVVADSAVLARLLAVIERSVEVSSSANAIGKDTVLLGEGIGLDSLEILRVINEVEDEFGLTVDESQLKPLHLRTVASLASFIEERMSSERQPRDLRRAG